MEVNPHDEKLGLQWFLGAGLFAVLLSIFLASADNFLSTSDKEKKLGEALHQLRQSQTSLASLESDAREFMGGSALVASSDGQAAEKPSPKADDSHE